MLSHPRRQQYWKLILYFQLLAYRMAGASVIILWTSVASCIMFGILKCAGKLRVSAKDEQEGKRDTSSNTDTLFFNIQCNIYTEVYMHVSFKTCNSVSNTLTLIFMGHEHCNWCIRRNDENAYSFLLGTTFSYTLPHSILHAGCV